MPLTKSLMRDILSHTSKGAAMHKAYLINAIAQTITEVEVGDYKTFYPLLGCDCFTTVGLEEEDTLYVDDEGLLKSPFDFFMYEGYPQPLAGNGLVMGTNDEGESIAPKMSLEDLKSRVTFLNGFQIRRMLADGKFAS